MVPKAQTLLLAAVIGFAVFVLAAFTVVGLAGEAIAALALVGLMLRLMCAAVARLRRAEHC